MTDDANKLMRMLGTGDWTGVLEAFATLTRERDEAITREWFCEECRYVQEYRPASKPTLPQCPRCGSALFMPLTVYTEKTLTAQLAAATKARETAEAKVSELIAPLAPLLGADLLREGGPWLGAARSWLQWNKRNGSDVTWGSGDVLQPPFTVREVESLAADVAAAAMVGHRTTAEVKHATLARWKMNKRSWIDTGLMFAAMAGSLGVAVVPHSYAALFVAGAWLLGLIAGVNMRRSNGA